MGHTVYISFKAEDIDYKEYIQEIPGLDYIDRSLNAPIDSEDDDAILRIIREQYLSSSTVTIHLIGLYGADNRGWQEQRFIKRELQASLYHGEGNTKSGILGVVLPAAVPNIYKGSQTCLTCGKSHNVLTITAATTISEFGYNFFIPNSKCSWSEDDRYCVLVPWDEFVKDAASYIDQAFDKRSAPIAAKTRVRPQSFDG